MSWRDEARQDRLVRAQIDRDQAAADARARLAERAAAAAERRSDSQDRAAGRARARSARAERRAARLDWARRHVVDLLFIPVIVVPGLLAWTAMAAYGRELYGPPGLLLPAFSEGGMWVFAAANTITRRRHPERPTWHLLTGTWVFAGAGAALNFAHGLALTGNLAGPQSGAVMALVSAAGVTAHQLVTAGPRRGADGRRQARLDRVAARRELAVRAAAVRTAAAELDEHGAARLVYRPGLVTLRRGRIVPAIVPGLPVTPAGPGVDWGAEMESLTADWGEDVTGVTAPGQPAPAGGGIAVADPPGNSAGNTPRGLAVLVTRARAAIARGDLPPRPSQRALRDLLGIRMGRAAQVQRALDHEHP